MDAFIMTVQLILSLSILVIVHEFGHFIAARAFGIKVEKFYLFFDAWGKKLFSFKRGDTEYGVGWLPLGGYVKITGMIDESVDTEQMKEEPQPWEFRSKPAWQRLIVMVGGVVLNVVLAFIIFSCHLMYYGESYIKNSDLNDGIVPSEIAKKEIGLELGDKIIAVNGETIERFNGLISSKIMVDKNPILTIERDGKKIDLPIPADLANTYSSMGINKIDLVEYRFKYSIDEIRKEKEAQKIGLKVGDSLLTINNKSILFFDQLRSELFKNKNKSIELKILRNGKEETLIANIDSTATLGIKTVQRGIKFSRQSYSFFEAIPAGISKSFSAIIVQLKAFGKMFAGELDPMQSLGGPIAIAYEMYGGSMEKFWLSTGLLSMILAFMNILPIPALDGGHVVFLLIEMVTRKPVSEKVLIGAQYIGMAILLTLMIFVFGKDIWTYIIQPFT